MNILGGFIRLSIVQKNSFAMSVFTQQFNPIKGVQEWAIQHEDYDFHQEVARSSFADMLHDTKRNQLYEKALKKAIEKIHSRGKKANVLDIGTGTGLLSMMAIRNGADTVTACEAFSAMSKCAVKIIEANGMKDKIKVIPKRSTELEVGANKDLSFKCNILVTEVFDTELIGEGALSTFRHAHDNLLEKDSIVVPQSATLYAQVVECPLSLSWHKIKDFYNDDGEQIISVPKNVKDCSGSAAVHDIQLSQIPLTSFNTLVSPVPVFQFDWSGKTPIQFERTTISNLKVEQNGTAQAVFIWWDLKMDYESKIILSCAPIWAHPSKNTTIPWRDHWMQAIYYFPKEIYFNKNDEINLISSHDEYSLWFNIKNKLVIENKDYLSPICICGIHTFSRSRIGQINDLKRRKKLLSAIEKNIKKEDIVLILGNGFYLSLFIAKIAKHVYIFENNLLSERIMSEFIKCNNFHNIKIIGESEKIENIILPKSVNVVMAEPYFITSILPWDNLYFYNILKQIKNTLSENVILLPKKVEIKAIAMQFSDLYKIRKPLGICEGFQMSAFDDLIEKSSAISDDTVEAQPLWEYPGIALSEINTLADLDLRNDELNISYKQCFDIKEKKECNGIAFWVDWWHGDGSDEIISTGPIKNPKIGECISWDLNSRQGVCLFPNKNTSLIEYDFKINVPNGDITFKLKQ